MKQRQASKHSTRGSSSSSPAAEHTRGPWKVKRIGKHLYVEAAGPKFICDMQIQECTDADEVRRCEADAHLIALVPDLLDTCRSALATMAELAREAGDVPTWNEGGDAFETWKLLSGMLAKAERGSRNTPMA